MPERRKHRESRKSDVDASSYQGEHETSGAESSHPKHHQQQKYHSAQNPYLRQLGQMWNPFSRSHNHEDNGDSRSRESHQPSGSKDHSSHPRKDRQEQTHRSTNDSNVPQHNRSTHGHSSKRHRRRKEDHSPERNLYTAPLIKPTHGVSGGYARPGKGGVSPRGSRSPSTRNNSTTRSTNQLSSAELALREQNRRGPKTGLELAGGGNGGVSPPLSPSRSGSYVDEPGDPVLSEQGNKKHNEWRDAYAAMKHDGVMANRVREKKRQRAGGRR